MRGNQEIIDMVENSYFSIAKLCCNLYMTIDPDVILIGGGMPAAAKVEALSSNGMDEIEIPAFLRKQAD